jgi:N-acetylglutamate synthase-like GNAT family acetyltransferase
LNDRIPEITVRDAENHDGEALAKLLAELGYPQGSDVIARKVRKLGKRLNDRILVAICGSEVIGLLSLHVLPLLHLPGSLCRVTALIVSHKHRRQYVGQRLLEVAEAYAKAHECIKVEITSGDQRCDAHAFYQRIGYQEVSRRFIKMI